MRDHLKSEQHLQLISDEKLASTFEKQALRVLDVNRTAVIRSMKAVYFLARRELAQTHLRTLRI